MKICKKYSHMGGEEYLLIHHNTLYKRLLSNIKTSNLSSIKSENWLTKNDIYLNDLLAKEKILIGFHFQTLQKAFDLIGAHYLQYIYDNVNISIEIFPTKKSFTENSYISACYENEIDIYFKNKKSNLNMPLLLLGIEP